MLLASITARKGLLLVLFVTLAACSGGAAPDAGMDVPALADGDAGTDHSEPRDAPADAADDPLDASRPSDAAPDALDEFSPADVAAADASDAPDALDALDAPDAVAPADATDDALDAGEPDAGTPDDVTVDIAEPDAASDAGDAGETGDADAAIACVDDTPCGTAGYCSGGVCVARNALGAACVGSNECASGFCADGVCCDRACGGLCEACSAAKKGQGADGLCDVLANGTDPDAECAEQSPSSCGTDGSCDGAGACRLYARGTVCVASSCANGVQQNADTCDGLGACVDQGSVACAPYICDATACRTSCFADVDCASTHYCAGGACVPKLLLGAPCAGAGNECETGHCVDGVCCSTACTGTCRSCSGRWNDQGDGICGPILIGDPDNECANICCNGFCTSTNVCNLQ